VLQVEQQAVQIGQCPCALFAPLSQVLSDGTDTYLYGLDRLARVAGERVKMLSIMTKSQESGQVYWQCLWFSLSTYGSG
jgi:hypothetical protein